MLSKLFGSQARVKILKIFLLNPDKQYYTRQLARDLDLQVNAVRRELNNLSNLGLIKSVEAEKDADPKAKKDKKYFQVQADFLLFEELKKLFITAQLLDCQDFVSDLQKICTPKFLLLSGVFVSDHEAKVDLLLVGNISRTKLLALINDLEKNLGRELNYTIMKETEFIYRRQIMDRFIIEILKRKNLIIVDKLSDDLIIEKKLKDMVLSDPHNETPKKLSNQANKKTGENGQKIVNSSDNKLNNTSSWY